MVIHPLILRRLDALRSFDWKIYSFQLSLITGGARHGLALRLVDDHGVESWGEIAPFPGRSRETLDQAFSQLLDIFNSGDVRIDPLFPSVQCGLENALSLFSEPITAPLYAFLHGTPEEVLQRAETAYAQGYTTAKVKVSSLPFDVAMALLNALKDRFRLRVDCNSAFSFDDAVSLFSHFDRNTFDYIEDPTFEVDRLADFRYPFALDEAGLSSLTLPLDAYTHLYGFILKPTLLGGKKGCAPLIACAQKNHLKVVFSPTFESGIGLLQILSVAKHFHLLSDPLGLDTFRYLKQDLLTPAIDFCKPELTVTAIPGINDKLLKEVAHGKCALPNL
jgi:o-succinylbenzoate synthase